MYAQDSIELLQKSGIQFKKHEEDGIDPHLFAELLTTSGVVFMENVTWLSFHAYVRVCAHGLLVYSIFVLLVAMILDTY